MISPGLPYKLRHQSIIHRDLSSITILLQDPLIYQLTPAETFHFVSRFDYYLQDGGGGSTYSELEQCNKTFRQVNLSAGNYWYHEVEYPVIQTSACQSW